ncbi:MAG: crossover junction endodeoxyribonuclease RuvC [Candidatus Omnitrophica bacterium]|nr:crossover junction endodeoxyribonuclease RuvC [Candidatus Omnitrophota bacterium]
MIIVGVDPGLQRTGYGVIRCRSRANISPGQRRSFSGGPEGVQLLEAGVIRSSARESMPARLRAIYRGIAGVTADFKPDVLVLEELYSHYAHPRTAILMAHARGVIALAAAEAGIAVVGYAARSVKKAVTGTGAAQKIQVQRMVQRALRLPQTPQPHDVADALALAITHWHETAGRL